MVNFSTPLVSSTFSRVTDILSRNTVLGNVSRLEDEILLLNEQLSTGIRLVRPSIDPIAANRVLDFEARLGRNDRFVRNIQTEKSRFNVAEDIIEGATEVATKAKDIVLQQLGPAATASTRSIAATEVGSLIRRAMGLANSQFEGRFLLGGSRTDRAPTALQSTGVLFQGNVQDLQTQVADSISEVTNVLAHEVFGLLSSENRGLTATTLTPVDLNPQLSGVSTVSSLLAGQGIPMQSITITGPAGSATIDLSIAKSISDILDLINARTGTTGVTAAIQTGADINANRGIRLTAAGAIAVSDVPGGVTAERLGIDTNGVLVASPILGGDLNPRLTPETRMGMLFLGVGMSYAGVTLTNTINGTPFADVITMTSATTVEQFLDAVNLSEAFTFGQINEQGTGMDIFNRLSGGRLVISENAGTTAASLGLLTAVERTQLVDLNGGRGIATVPGNDLRITRKNGTNADFNLDTARTIRDVVNLLDADPFLTVTLTPGGAISITDTTGGAGALTVRSINGSFAAFNLGISGSVPGVTLTGTALTAVGPQVEGLFTALSQLQAALTANDTDAIVSAQRLVDLSAERIRNSRADAGARSAALEMTRVRLVEQSEQLKGFISLDKDADLAAAASAFQTKQTILQSALLVASRLLQTSLLNFL